MVRYSLSCMTLSFTTPRRFIPTHHEASPRTSTLVERMKLMTSNTSASVRVETPHGNRTTRTNTIMNALKRRAQAVLNDTSIDPQNRAIIRYALETNDPWLAELVRRADAGEDVVEDFQSLETDGQDVSEEKIVALAEMIWSRWR